ncbi:MULTISPECIES: peptidyl-prolyl cis-trans isomerase [unclassified Psychrobacillus]|uniref:peptidyl-prolyl cis-trans isomerase n=1 Tax=unclassified Psychrobacillus TaxID=2636677 RepID=UPI00249675A7|nr:peptidyl-prolyl cis-trans isomerase [Psychrobacillus sp. NEAU-3TGS]MDI2589513.1 peptidyl-prolyl cis-trans isomerase [Psychrobacillus sp. NEAU-3TGS]
MEFIIPVKGAVKFTITLDPTVWIFDDRKIDLDEFFSGEYEYKDELEEYTKVTSAHWSREIIEGATVPPTLQSEKKYERTKALTSTFGVELQPFIQNAEPLEDASTLVIETTEGEHSFPLNELDTLLLKFSHKGKPLREDGPVHVIKKDGSNINNPIKFVTAFRVE